MIPILALAAIRGGLQGARNVKQAKAEDAAKVEERAQEIADARLKAQRDHNSKMLLEKEKARLRVLEKEQEEQRALRTTAMQGIRFRTGLTDYPDMPIGRVAEATGYDKLDPNAVFSARVPVIDADGEQVYRDEDGGRPAFDVAQISLTKRDDPNAAVTQFVNKFSGQTLDWWEKNSPATYNNSMSFLTGNLIQLGQEAGEPAIPNLRPGVPRIPRATVNSLVSAYGVERATILLTDSLGKSAETIRALYRDEFGINISRTADPKPTPVTDPETGETEIVVGFKDSDVIDPTIETKGVPDAQFNAQLEPIKTAVGKGVKILKPEVQALAEKEGIESKEIWDSVFGLRDVFADTQWFQMGSLGKVTLNGEPQRAFNEFWTKRGLFSRLSPEESLSLIEMTAGPGVQGIPFNKADDQIVPLSEGGSMTQGLGTTPARRRELQEEELEWLQKKYGYDNVDVVGKLDATTDAYDNVTMLINGIESGQTVPGFAGSVIKTIEGAKAQVGYFMEAIQLSDKMTPAEKERRLADLRSISSKLDSGFGRVNTANALMEYHQGVLVYQMAMVLQGGNAAARTISDADIERISKLLQGEDGLATKDRKLAVMKALRRQLVRRKAFLQSYASGDESKMYAAGLAEDYLSSTEYKGLSPLDFVEQQFANGASAGNPTNAPEKPLIIPAPNGRGFMYLQPNGGRARQKHPDIDYTAAEQALQTS